MIKKIYEKDILKANLFELDEEMESLQKSSEIFSSLFSWEFNNFVSLKGNLVGNGGHRIVKELNLPLPRSV